MYIWKTKMLVHKDFSKLFYYAMPVSYNVVLLVYFPIQSCILFYLFSIPPPPPPVVLAL